MHPHPVAVVTGANRGLGKETAKQLAERGYTVVLTGRDGGGVEAAAAEIREQVGGPGEVWSHPLDVTDTTQAKSLGDAVKARYGRCDVLVNNAGAWLDDRVNGSPLVAAPEMVARSFDVNTLGPLRVTQALAPLIRERGGNIVNVSSGMAGLNEMGGGAPGYRLSKTALSALTRIVAHELQGDGVRVNAVCPGWVRTDMGGPNAHRTIPEGAASIVWAATLDSDGPTGGFFRDGNALAW